MAGNFVGNPNMYESDLSIRRLHSGGARRLYLAGELHVANVHQLLDAVGAAEGPLVIDTRGLDFIDSTGAEALARASERVGESQCRLLLGERTLHVLQVTGLTPDFLPTDAP